MNKIASLITGLFMLCSINISASEIKKISQNDLETLILSKSATSQTVTFGEQHGRFRKDSDLVKKLLPKLKEQGFKYLAIELNRDKTKKSSEVEKILRDYVDGEIDLDNFNMMDLITVKSSSNGWMNLIDKAKEYGFEIVCYDASKDEFDTKKGYSYNKRDKIAFTNLKELIFKKDPKAKVIIYCGDGHSNEKEGRIIDWMLKSKKRFTNCAEAKGHTTEELKTILEKYNQYVETFKPLAAHLSEYTNDKNLSVSLTSSNGVFIGHYADIQVNLDKMKYKTR